VIAAVMASRIPTNRDWDSNPKPSFNHAAINSKRNLAQISHPFGLVLIVAGSFVLPDMRNRKCLKSDIYFSGLSQTVAADGCFWQFYLEH
jgi:hypothetical protein